MAELQDDGAQPKPHGLTLGFFKRFIELHGGRAAFTNLTTGDVCTRFLLPYTAATKFQLSLVDHVRQQPDGHLYAKPAMWFVSHAWSYLYLDVVDALDDFFQENGLDDSVAVWFCTFCNNQHEIKEQTYDFDHWFGIFRSSLREIGNVVMVMSPWNNPTTLTRTWCVFELYASIVENARFEIAMGRSQKESFLQDIRHDLAFTQMLATIQSEKSQTTIPSDRDNIFKLIRDEVGFAKLDRMVFGTIEEWMLRTVDKQIASASSPESKAEWLFTKGELYGTKGLMNEASIASRECYDIYRREKGEQFAGTWKALAQLATTQMYLGHPFGEVEMIYRDVLTHQEELLSRDHEDTLATMNYLAYGDLNSRQYEACVSILKECFERRCRLHGEEHPWTRETMTTLGSALRLQNKIKEALQWTSRCFDVELRVLGADDPQLYRTRTSMGFDYLDLGDFARAEDNFEAARGVCRRIFGPDHTNTINLDVILGETYRRQGKYADAEDILLLCLKDHANIPRTKEHCYKWLGSLYLGTQDYDQAASCLKEAIALMSAQGWNAVLFASTLYSQDEDWRA
ncbi:hypothetical protein AeRB84_015363 [Aphanomyces euteiches]|nr:hypothetical protein AeRB84_015363 [Aphanomyces euteiches]